jgi:DNA-binding NarL/FixJ family response regulator
MTDAGVDAAFRFRHDAIHTNPTSVFNHEAEEQPMTEGQSAQGLAFRQCDQPDVRPSGEPEEFLSFAQSSGQMVDVRDPVRVILAEDDVLLREGLASLLGRSGLDVVGQASDGGQLLAMARDLNPELVVTDIRMPPTHTTEGLDAARVIRKEQPDVGILVLSAHVDVEHAMELLASGRSVGYLLKSRITDVADFVDTLDRIAKGASVVDPALVQELVSARRRDDPLALLSARERDVLALMAEGRSNAGIAHRIWVTEGTVEKHVRSILSKLELPETGDDHRRVLAVIAFLDAR